MLFEKFIHLCKVDIPQRLVYGLVTAEREDKDGEICDYESTVPQYKAVIDEMSKASEGANIMPLREMHQLHAVGAGKAIEFYDSKKEIRMAFKVVDDSTWNKVLEKVLIGFSQGGRYLKTWMQDGKRHYTAQPGEVSLVDNPCLSGAVIEYVKADGTVEKFTTPAIAKSVKYLVPDGEHLPYTDDSGKPSHRLMGAAWAALHGGYRGNKYEGPDKEKAIAHLKEIYHSEGIEPPSEKALALFRAAADLEFGQDSELSTQLQKFSALVGELVGQQSAKGDAMNKEQIAACAKALGISEEEFTKNYVEGDALEKGKKGLAALHAHLKKAVAHHEKMQAHHAKIAEMHKAHGDMHGQMAEHLENCMKAHGACQDGDEAEKILKAIAPAPMKEDPAAAMSKEEIAELVKASTAAAIEEFKKNLPDPNDPASKVITIPRGAPLKAEDLSKANTAMPIPV